MVERIARETLQAVLPLALGNRDGEDLERAVTQGRTLRHFFCRDQLLCVNVVAPAQDIERIGKALRPLQAEWLQYRIHDENVAYPGLTAHGAPGWHKQQIVKLAAPEWLGAPAWLTLDADVICTKPFAIGDLFPDGRAIMGLDDVWDAPIYVDWAWPTREMLGMVAPPPIFAGAITPLLYVAPIMRALHEVLESVHGRPWKEALLDERAIGGWRRTGRSWAENQLYYMVAARTGLLRRHHALYGIDSPQRPISGGVWTNEEWKDWNPAPLFDRSLPGFFAVCGSYTGMPAKLVAEKIAPFLDSGPVDAPDARELSAFMADARVERSPTPENLRVRILSRQPLVLYALHDRTGLANVLNRGVMEPLRHVPALILLALPSTRESIVDSRVLAAAIARRQREFPLHRVLVLCNTEVELDYFRELGVDCILANDNLFIDERPFLAVEGVEPEFDAVYNAGFHPLKRHHLAAEIRSLAVIFADWHSQYQDYAEGAKRALAHASFLNQPTPQSQYRFFGRDELARQLARARTGLCLSEVEGAMRASIEYLFAGLPVVSTLSRGGRDQFFDSDFCVTVPPAPQLIADAVRELIKLEIPRQYVRRRTMHKLALHRERLIQAVHRMLASMGCARLPKLDWPWLGDARGLYSVSDFHKALMWD